MKSWQMVYEGRNEAECGCVVLTVEANNERAAIQRGRKRVSRLWRAGKIQHRLMLVAWRRKNQE